MVKNKPVFNALQKSHNGSAGSAVTNENVRGSSLSNAKLPLAGPEKKIIFLWCNVYVTNKSFSIDFQQEYCTQLALTIHC